MNRLIAKSQTTLLLVAAMVGLYCASVSIWLAVTLLWPIPYYDQWDFVHIEYFLYVKHQMPLELLFRQTNEHRIFTARLVLLADAILFSMRGWLPLFVSYISLAGISWILSVLATAERIRQIAVFFMLLGITWSISQWEAFSWSLEVFFPMQHILALGALLAFAKAVIASDKRKGVGWFIVAVLCDFLTIWSSASGPFLIIPLLLLCWWLRAVRTGFFVAIFLIHALFLVGYMAGYQYLNDHPIMPWQSFSALIGFFGWPFKVWGVSQVAGWICLATFFGIITISIKKALTGQGDFNLLVLLAFALFIFIEGGLLAYARPYNGVEMRHAPMPILFTATLIAILWRQRSPVGQWLALALGAVTLISTNDHSFETQWRNRAKFFDEMIAHVRAGDYQESWMKLLCPNNTHWLKGDIELLKEQRVGPFY